MASTGHLVLAQLTANHTLDALQRLRDRGADPYLLAQTLIGVTAQRLLRRVCTHCVTEYEPAPAALQRLGLMATDGPFRRGAGCEQCRNTGYKGRAALYELADIDTELGQQIAAGGPIEAAWQQALARHGGSLWDAARDMVRQGNTTAEEALRVLTDYAPPSS
jgi:type IV pilus assembly protein PilB